MEEINLFRVDSRGHVSARTLAASPHSPNGTTNAQLPQRERGPPLRSRRSTYVLFADSPLVDGTNGPPASTDDRRANLSAVVTVVIFRLGGCEQSQAEYMATAAHRPTNRPSPSDICLAVSTPLAHRCTLARSDLASVPRGHHHRDFRVVASDESGSGE